MAEKLHSAHSAQPVLKCVVESLCIASHFVVDHAGFNLFKERRPTRDVSYIALPVVEIGLDDRNDLLDALAAGHTLIVNITSYGSALFVLMSLSSLR